MATATRTFEQLRRAFPDGKLSGSKYNLDECPHCNKRGKCCVFIESDGVHIAGTSCFHQGADHNKEATAKVHAVIDSGNILRSTAPKQTRQSLDNTTASWGWPDKWKPMTEQSRAILAASRSHSYTPRLETLLAFGFRERPSADGRIRFAYPINRDGVLQFCKSAFCDIRKDEKRRAWPQFSPTGTIASNLLFGMDEAFPALPSGTILAAPAPAVFITEGQWDALTLHELGYPAVSIGCDKQKNIAPEFVDQLLHNAHRVYLVPDVGAESTMDELARLFPAERCFIVEMRGAKDISELREKLAAPSNDAAYTGEIGELLFKSPLPQPENLKPIHEALDGMIDRKRMGKSSEPERVSLEYKLTRMSEYKPKPLEWFWPGKIPKNKIAMFAGEPGAAKSLVTCWLAAVQSMGGCLPGEKEPSLKPAEVAMMYCEDDTEDTVLPRLIAVEADCDRVHDLKITKVAEDGTKEERHLALDTDLHILRKCLRDNPGIRVATIDPITNYTGSAKITDEKAMRDVLTPLKELAAEHAVTIILVAHLNKRSDVNALNRVLGAVAMTGVARSAWLFAADEEAPEDGFDHGLMLHGKLNVARKAKQSLKYTIKTKKIAELPEDAEAVPYIEWNGASEMTAEDVLDTSSGKRSEKATKRHEAEALLRSLLSDGPKFATEIENIATARGITDATLRRAKKSLKVQSEKEKGTANGRIYWCLPGDGRLPIQSADDANY